MEAIAETDRLQSVFPEEIWLLIGKKISDIHDHLRLRDSSVYFRFLFKNELDRAMFPEVAKILHAQLQPYPEGHNIMQKCRTVCRYWEECVDAALENFPIYLHPLRNVAVEYNLKYFYLNVQGFSQPNNISDFLQHFAQTHSGTKRNPFACRSVWIDHITSQTITDNLFEQSLQLFRVYGQHIQHCVIRLATNDHNTLAHYRKLHEMLELMPNLRLLHLSIFPNGLRLVELQETTLNNLELHLKTHPLPNLKYLKFLQINELPTSVTQSLIRANPQITTLDASRGISFLHSAMLQEHLPNLELFGALLENEQQITLVKNLSFVWPLRKLSLQIRDSAPTKYVFEILGKGWSATLTELKLYFWNYWKLLDVAPLQLPNLQKFSLKTLCFTPLDFLLPTKSSLKTLSLTVNTRNMLKTEGQMQAALEAENTVKFFGFCNNVLESNIWSIFPNLRSVDYLDNARGYEAKPQVYRRFDWMIKQKMYN